MAEEESRYISFLLRLWSADGDGESATRASLESPLTGECKGFANLEGLFSYLRQLSKFESEGTHNESG